MDASRSRDLINGVASCKDKTAIMLRRVSGPYEELAFACEGFLDFGKENEASVSLAAVSRIDFRPTATNLIDYLREGPGRIFSSLLYPVEALFYGGPCEVESAGVY